MTTITTFVSSQGTSLLDVILEETVDELLNDDADSVLLPSIKPCCRSDAAYEDDALGNDDAKPLFMLISLADDMDEDDDHNDKVIVSYKLPSRTNISWQDESSASCTTMCSVLNLDDDGFDSMQQAYQQGMLPAVLKWFQPQCYGGSMEEAEDLSVKPLKDDAHHSRKRRRRSETTQAMIVLNDDEDEALVRAGSGIIAWRS
jgi:hypothetical protein